MSRLLIELPADRDYCGRLTLFNDDGETICGPFPVAGRAGDAVAAANGNARRDPLLRYGDTPQGVYAVRHLLKSGKGTAFNASEFGKGGVVVIEGVAGDAAHAEANGRFHLLISGGAVSAKGLMRATAGGPRLADEDMARLFGALRRGDCKRCEVSENDGLPLVERVDPNAPLGLQDPFPLHIKELARPGRAQLREGLLSGAMVFGMTVSFIAMESGESRASTPDTTADKPSVHDQAAVPAAAVLPTPRYVKLAYGTGGHVEGGAAPANNAQQQLNNMATGKNTLGQGFDNGTAHDDTTVSSAPVTVPQATPAAVEQALTPQQQQQLGADQQYQQYQQQAATAQKDYDDAAAKSQEIKAQLGVTTDPVKKGELQVQLTNTLTDQDKAKSAVDAAHVNAEIRKKVVVGAPILLPPAPKK